MRNGARERERERGRKREPRKHDIRNTCELRDT